MAILGLAMAAFILAAEATALASAASLVTFIFGDSLTEVGNNKYLQYSLARSDYPWYGIDFPGGKATGRFTNGRTIGDMISEKLGIPSPPPYLSLSMNDDALLTGVNYASGGAGILNETGLYFIQRLSFYDQIDCFKKTKESIKAKIGEAAANKLCNEAMYFIGLGSNDYVNNYLQPFLADGQQYTSDEFVELLISTLKKQLSVLIRTLQAISHESSNLIMPDAVPTGCQKGFKISNTSCCNVDTTIGGLCLPNSKLCSNRKDYVFWDAFHPSDAANAVLAEKFFSTLFSAPPSVAPKPSP
ncbi:hypothetical protein SADUNF_Sadunf17G0119200 [Salix dunnii]|uniref:GDSL esterase/lipase n=1 Tax=Salix dunnii TaxID=1413687 RepID=A0A835J3W8_9ROSI|nr:hypothetical protein SADUNF_Sadunf17G0119200 [Salix dunnii]